MMRTLLVLNTGSSSVKFRVFGLMDDLPLLAGGKVVDIGGCASFSAQLAGQEFVQIDIAPDITHEGVILCVLRWLDQVGAGWSIDAVAHRIVHGGDRYTSAVRLSGEDLDYLRSLSALAPLHQPHNLAGVDILLAQRPDVPQYGCFDTAFHACHEALFSSYALPKSIRDQGVRRYGFHGLSYDWIAHVLRRDYLEMVAKRVVVAHLGNGASLCAMQNGVSVDTTMGMTALEGLPMGTRCGNIDAGAVIYMQRFLGFSLDAVENVLYEESGLKGLSGVSNDVKTLLSSDLPAAKFAIDYFVLKVAQQIAQMAVSLGGMDALVFTGGIGENAESIRQGIINRLKFMPDFQVMVIAANEERSMAQEVYEIIAKDNRQ